MNYLTESDIDKMSTDIGAALREEPKVRLIVNSKNKYWEGGINGHFFRFPTGTEIAVPASIAALIKQSAETKWLGEERVKPFKSGAGKKV